jgi:bud emergence protein 1
MQQHPNTNMPLAPVQASVPRYCFDNDMYWYIIECQMEDGRWFELSRYYADFYDFQIALLEAFPEEAGNKDKPRSLPFMPGPVAHVTDAISNGRRQNLDEYIKKIIAMPPHISKSVLVRNLFKPKPNQDFEIDPNALGEDYRLSGGSQGSLNRTQSNQTGQSSTPNLPGSGYGGMGPPPGPQRTSHGQQRTPSHPANGGPYLHQQASTLTQNSTTSHNSNPGRPPNAGSGTGGAMKIKVFFQDDIIAIRVAQDISFQGLKEKLVERLKVNEDIAIQYRDEQSGDAVDMRSDRDLDAALARNPKLTLVVNYAAG